MARAMGLVLLVGAVWQASGSEEPPAGTTSEGPVAGMTFAWIPTGEFLMGSRLYGPEHSVAIRGFELMTTEVTQGVWKEVLGVFPARFYSGLDSDFLTPVENVSWADAGVFLDSLNAMGDGYVYRLPSEAEWEYACRAGTATVFYWGQAMDGGYCWFADNSGASTHQVGQTLPNAWGLFDMSGNVAEWCEDCYWSSYSGAPSDGSPRGENPDNPSHVVRGGSWESYASGCRSAFRDYCTGIGGKSPCIGLRVARSRL